MVDEGDRPSIRPEPIVKHLTHCEYLALEDRLTPVAGEANEVELGLTGGSLQLAQRALQQFWLPRCDRLELWPRGRRRGCKGDDDRKEAQYEKVEDAYLCGWMCHAPVPGYLQAQVSCAPQVSCTVMGAPRGAYLGDRGRFALLWRPCSPDLLPRPCSPGPAPPALLPRPWWHPSIRHHHGRPRLPAAMYTVPPPADPMPASLRSGHSNPGRRSWAFSP